MDTNTLGKEIAKTRKAKRMTQEQLGKLVGLRKSSIGKMENGKTKLTTPRSPTSATAAVCRYQHLRQHVSINGFGVDVK